jgi:N-methylhydantoinase A/oxoprolinase/acetone carboxylase beta subunit
MTQLLKNRLAIDVGGTFVDFVYFDQPSGQVTIEKVSSAGLKRDSLRAWPFWG